MDKKINAVILSVPLILEDGMFLVETISREEAMQFVEDLNPTNYCGHPTVKLVGVEPLQKRDSFFRCSQYDVALCISTSAWINFEQEYTMEDLEKMQIDYRLVHVGKKWW